MRGRLTYMMEMGDITHWWFTPASSISVDKDGREHFSWDGGFIPKDGDLVTFLDRNVQISWLTDISWRAYPESIGRGYDVDVVRMEQGVLF